MLLPLIISVVGILFIRNKQDIVMTVKKVKIHTIRNLFDT